MSWKDLPKLTPEWGFKRGNQFLCIRPDMDSSIHQVEVSHLYTSPTAFLVWSTWTDDQSLFFNQRIRFYPYWIPQPMPYITDPAGSREIEIVDQ